MCELEIPTNKETRMHREIGFVCTLSAGCMLEKKKPQHLQKSAERHLFLHWFPFAKSTAGLGSCQKKPSLLCWENYTKPVWLCHRKLDQFCGLISVQNVWPRICRALFSGAFKPNLDFCTRSLMSKIRPRGQVQLAQRLQNTYLCKASPGCWFLLDDGLPTETTYTIDRRQGFGCVDDGLDLRCTCIAETKLQQWG